jgi:hypothetical protein
VPFAAEPGHYFAVMLSADGDPARFAGELACRGARGRRRSTDRTDHVDGAGVPRATDRGVFAATVVSLSVGASIASYLAARRAARVDPIAVLRNP